jgi:subtilase family serine protease
VRALKVGTSNAGPTSALIPSTTPPGVYYVIAEADGAGVIAETNEANNALAAKITVGPDLTVSALTAPSTATAGATISIGDTTKNTGGASDGAVTSTRFYLSKNTTLDGSDVVLGSRAVPVVAASASSTGSTSVTIPVSTTPGTYHIIAVCDATNVVAESNEGNNQKVIAITVNP